MYNCLFPVLYALMSVIIFQVFLGGAGLQDRAGVVFSGEKTTFLNHECREWIVTDSGSYSVLLSTATKLAPDTAGVKVDRCQLNFWHFYSCTVNILRWVENLSRTKEMAMPSWQNPQQEEGMQVWDAEGKHSSEKWYFLFENKIQGPKAATKVTHDNSLPLPLTIIGQRQVLSLSYTHAGFRYTLAMVFHYWQELKWTESHEDTNGTV